MVIINHSCVHLWPWRIGRLIKHSPHAQLCVQLAFSWDTTVPLLLFTTSAPALQPGRLEVSIRCHTSLPASLLLFSLLFTERSPQNSASTTATLIMPAGDAATLYLSPQFEFLQNILITHQLFRLSHKQELQQKDQDLQGQRKWAKLLLSPSNPSRPGWRYGGCSRCGKV